jgi:hypothetical protein
LVTGGVNLSTGGLSEAMDTAEQLRFARAIGAQNGSDRRSQPGTDIV